MVGMRRRTRRKEGGDARVLANHQSMSIFISLVIPCLETLPPVLLL